MKLEEILDGRNINLKRNKKKRIEQKNGLYFYAYLQKELTDKEYNWSYNIMVIGEISVGKSTGLYCFINYLQGI